MENKSQHWWYIAYSVFFLVIAVLMLRSLYTVHGRLPTDIPLFDLIIISLATFRLTRLFVYDKITFFLRDMLQHAEETYTEEGVTYFRKVARRQGPIHVAYELLTCPWCFSIWIGLFVTYSYFLDRQIFWFPILLFAVSGVASSVQIFVNMVGWIAENKKLEAEEKVNRM